jgi:hypothetical protein
MLCWLYAAHARSRAEPSTPVQRWPTWACTTSAEHGAILRPLRPTTGSCLGIGCTRGFSCAGLFWQGFMLLCVRFKLFLSFSVQPASRTSEQLTHFHPASVCSAEPLNDTAGCCH